MKICRKVILLCYAFVLPVVLFIVICPNLVLRVFTDNIELITHSIPSLLVMLSSYLIAVPTFVWFCAVSGTGNTLSSLWIAIIPLGVYIGYISIISNYIPNLMLSLYFLLCHNWKRTKL